MAHSSFPSLVRPWVSGQPMNLPSFQLVLGHGMKGIIEHMSLKSAMSGGSGSGGLGASGNNPSSLEARMVVGGNVFDVPSIPH